MSEPLISCTGLTKRYEETLAVDGLDLEVRPGEVFGFLGPNGAGKTTTVSMLNTLVAPTSGEARVLGHDLATEAEAIRRGIGYVPQELTGDKTLTGWENAVFHARLHHMRGAERNTRCEAVLKLVGLWDERDKRVKKYSGGMKKKLDLACGLIHRPKLLFLDEPSLGLDVESRLALWDHVEGLRDEGTGIFLCTNSMEEADRLSTRIGIIDGGKLVRDGSPEALKASIGGEVVVLVPDQRNGGTTESLQQALDGAAEIAAVTDAGESLHVTVTGSGAAAIPSLVTRATEAGVGLVSASFHGPSLEDVFVATTGREYAE